MEANRVQETYATLDQGAVARCRRGEAGAWTELVQRFSPYVYAIASRAYRLERHDAEDVFQEVFLRTWLHLGELRDEAAIRPWIGQLTRRLCVDRVRLNARESRRAEREAVAATASDDVFGRVDDSIAVRDAISKLPVPQREILGRFFVLGESQATIATALGVAEGTVASRICRARSRLRLQLAA